MIQCTTFSATKPCLGLPLVFLIPTWVLMSSSHSSAINSLRVTQHGHEEELGHHTKAAEDLIHSGVFHRHLYQIHTQFKQCKRDGIYY